MRFALVLAVAMMLTVPAQATETVNWSYDALGRLVKTVVVTSATGKTVTTNYTFDKAGNRINVTVSGA